MSKIDEVLVLILDGAWHDFSEIMYALQIDYLKLERIVRLLAEFAFIHIKGHEICIDSNAKDLLESITNNLNKK